MTRNEGYNDVMATAMVMGAASGRVMGEGSIQAIFDKSESDYNWDQMWAANNLEIQEAATYQDISTAYANEYKDNARTILLGAQKIRLMREGSGIDMANDTLGIDRTQRNAQNNFNSAILRGHSQTIAGIGGAFSAVGKSGLLNSIGRGN